VTEFLDNEHFSNLESLILQINPNNNYADFTVLMFYPQLTTEKDKIKDILNVSDVKVIEKVKKDFPDKGFENDIDKLLKKPLMQMLQETQSLRALSSLSCINTHLNLSNETSNFKQFNLENFVLSNFMKLDLAAMNALCIFPKNLESKPANENDYGTLIDLLDQCKTQIGSRCLRRWVKQPLQDIAQIERR
jgi:DNA mismatch repair protein MSH2